MKMIFTNVLVIGGGIAALKAAIEARSIIDDILIVSKGHIGKSGCSIISEGILNGTFGKDDSPDLYYGDIIKGSADVADPKLAWTMAENAKNAVLSLEDVGVKFVREDGSLSLDISGGNSVARTVRVDPPGPGCGKVIPIKLAERAKELGVNFLDGYTVIKLFESEGRAVSALAFDGDDFIQINFKSLVIATGGAGKLYKNTTNPKGISGDGLYLAYDLGASLIDMEYVQFFPTVALNSYLVLPFIFTDGAIMLNADGERFIENYDPILKEKTTRDKMSQAIFTEAIENRSVEGGVYISYKVVPEELLDGKYRKEIDYFLSKGIDLKKEDLLVKPACHFFMGGIKIDEECKTEIAAVYACGECAGGTHGANRLAGNALVETLVFGEIAGKNAAKYAKLHDHIEVETNDFIENLPIKKGKDGLKGLIDDLKSITWNSIGIIRNEEGIRGAIEKINDIGIEFSELTAVGHLSDYFMLRNLITISKAIAISALERKETRGAHYRSDYPNKDDSFKKAILIKSNFELSYEPR